MLSLTAHHRQVLLAVSYAQQRWTDARVADVVEQLTTPRMQSGMGLLPASMSSQATSRLLRSLRAARLVTVEPGVVARHQRYRLTDDGQAEVAATVATYTASIDADDLDEVPEHTYV